MGERGYLSTIAGLMALALLDQGRLDEAEDLASVSREACDEADTESQMLWRQSQARVLAARSDYGEAERLAPVWFKSGPLGGAYLAAKVGREHQSGPKAPGSFYRRC
jgi:hypothetical protein